MFWGGPATRFHLAASILMAVWACSPGNSQIALVRPPPLGVFSRVRQLTAAATPPEALKVVTYLLLCLTCRS